MPIVINEFEITVDRPAAEQGAPPVAQPGQPSQRLRPDEIVRVMRLQRDRLLRVRAT